MSFDIVSDMLTRIRNAQQVRLSDAVCRLSKFCISILDVLKEEGYIKDHSIIKSKHVSQDHIKVSLKYYNNLPVIHTIKRISKQSVRCYTKISDLPPYMNSLGIYILSTSKGVMSDKKARSLNVGGELICKVF